MTEHNQSEADIEVHVTFATANGPYNARFATDTTATTVLQGALTKFNVSADGTTRYYLLFNGAELTGTETLGALVDHGHSLKFSLRTETISG